MLHAPEQFGKGRVVGNDDGRLRKRTVIHQQVDAVPLVRRLGEFHGHRRRFRFGDRSPEYLGIVNDIGTNTLEPIQNLGKVFVFLLEFVDQVGRSKRGYFTIELVDLFSQFLVPAGNMANDFLQLLFQPRNIFTDTLLFVFGQRMEDTGLDHFSVCNRRNRKSHGRPDQGGAGFRRLFVQCLQF